MKLFNLCSFSSIHLSYLRLIFVLILFSVDQVVFGRLTAAPGNSMVLAGSSLTLPCCTDLSESVYWKRSTSGGFEDIFAGEYGFRNGFRDNRKFSISNSSGVGCYNLTIASVNLTDAARYSCTDEGGFGDRVTSEVVVLEYLFCQESYPKEEYMGENEFGLAQDQILISCIAKYHGSTTPKTIWKWSPGGRGLPEAQPIVRNENSVISSSLLVPASKEFDRAKVTCYLQSPGDQDLKGNQAHWTSKQFNINHAVFQKSVASSCSANALRLECRPLCNTNLVRYANGLCSCEISYSPQISPLLEHVPLQSCEDGNEARRPTSKTDTEISPRNVSPKSEDEQTSWIMIVLAILVVILFAVLIVAVVVAAYYFKKNRKRKRRHPTAANDEVEFNQFPGPMCVINYGPITANNVTFAGPGSTVAQTTNTYQSQASKSEEESLLRGNTSDSSQPETVASMSGIKGLAVLGDEVFVANRSNRQMDVYNAQNSTFKRHLQLENVEDITDLVSCPEKLCLFIINVHRGSGDNDSKENEILRFDAKGENIKRWSVADQVRLLSVTPDSTVMATASAAKRLIEFDAEGNQIRQIQLANMRPVHSIKLNGDNYLVCHGTEDEDDHGVCKVDATGNLLEKYITREKSTLMNHPRYMAADGAGSILVADFSNGRVLVLDDNLRYKKTLYDERNGLCNPNRLCLDVGRNRLLVSDYEQYNRSLKIFGLPKL